MGEVWAARNELTNRDFAIKFLLTEFAHHTEAFDRFVREAETTGKLQHPSIVDVYDVAQTLDGRPFIVMELLAGEDLSTRLEREGTLSPMRTAAYFAQVSTGLDMAHQAGVIHRDLSTSNIFLARSSEGGEPIPKILDFGVSKTLGPKYAGESKTSDGAVLGNPMFMSPEQARGADQVDARTDVWSMGIVMYQCLTGMPPFKASNYNALMLDIITRPHRPLAELVPAADPEVIALVEQCLEKDRDRRVGSAREVAARLSAIARRLATDPNEVGRTPRRRATDRLPPPMSPKALRASASSAGSPWLVRTWTSLGQLAPPRWAVGAAAGMLGLMAGLTLARSERPEAVTALVSEPKEPGEVSTDVPKMRRFRGLAESEVTLKAAPPQKRAVAEPDTGLRSAVAKGVKEQQ